MDDRGAGWATGTGDGDSFEVVLYLLLAEMLEQGEGGEETTAAVLGRSPARSSPSAPRHEQTLVAEVLSAARPGWRGSEPAVGARIAGRERILRLLLAEQAIDRLLKHW